MIRRLGPRNFERVGEYTLGMAKGSNSSMPSMRCLRRRGESMMVIGLGRAAPLGDWFATLGRTPAFRGGISLGTIDDLQNMFDATDIDAALAKLKKSFGVDWILLVDGYPPLDPSSDTPQEATEVRFVVASPSGKQFATKSTMGGHPNVLQPRIAKAGMAWLRKVLAAK